MIKMIGKRIAELRKARGWTQERLAEKMGLSNNYIPNIENNCSIPSPESIMKIGIALDVTPNDVLLGISRAEKAYMAQAIAVLLAQCTAWEKVLLK